MDSLEVKNSEVQPAETYVDQPPFLEPVHPEEIYDESRVFPRVGDEYQVEIPNLATEEERIELRSTSLDDGRIFGFEYPVGIGLDIPVMWIHSPVRHIKEEHKEFPGPNLCPPEEPKYHSSGQMPGNSYQHGTFPQVKDCKVESNEQTGSEELSRSSGQDQYCSQNWTITGHSSVQRKLNEHSPLPGLAASSWTDAEAQSFLLGLYIFGKNLVQVMKFVESRTLGDVLSYYYGKFYRSDVYRRWAECRKVRSRRCILGLRIFNGPRQQELLSRLLAAIAKEVQDPLLEVFKTFNEGRSTFEEFILTLKSTVGAQVLVEAVAIGKGKHDLTGFALDPTRSNHGIPMRPEIPIGKACSSLSSGDIIKFLTGDFRLSKAKSNDLFWEAVWPRLLARGWHSEQPKDLASVTKHALVFLIPGVKKFSRKKLVKGEHYFDSVSDVLSKVASDPGLLELEVGVNDESNTKNENGWALDAESDKALPSQKNSCYLRPRVPGGTSELMKFTVVDTSLVQGEEPSRVRSLRNLPTDAGDSYVPIPPSADSWSESSPEHSGSDESSPSRDQSNTNQETTDNRNLDDGKRHSSPVGSAMQSDVVQNMPSFSGMMMPTNGHIAIDQGFDVRSSTSSSTGTMLHFDQGVHSTNSSTEINLQFDDRVNPGPQVFLLPVSKKRRLGVCKNERTNRKNYSFNKGDYLKEGETQLQRGISRGNQVGGEANSFLWSTFPNSSSRATLDESNNFAYCKELRNVPPKDGTRVSGEKYVPPKDGARVSGEKHVPPKDGARVSGEKHVPPKDGARVSGEKYVPPKDGTRVSREKPQDQHIIDLNLPQMPSDYEITADNCMPTSVKKNVPTADKPECPPAAAEQPHDDPPVGGGSSHALLSEQLSFNSRRQSTRSRPPTTRALEALACGFIGTKRKGRDSNFPSSSRSSRPARRPRRSTDAAAASFAPPNGEGQGASFHFTDPTVAVREWHDSNPQYQMFPSEPADKSGGNGSHELFGVP